MDLQLLTFIDEAVNDTSSNHSAVENGDEKHASASSQCNNSCGNLPNHCYNEQRRRSHPSSSPFSSSSPFLLWKRKFAWDYQCPEEDIYKELLLSALPHLVALITVPIYICSGAFLFTQLDDSLAPLPFHQVLLFAFTTVTTIGYGDVCPRSAMAKAFCIPYSLVGIPLVFISLAKMGELLAEFYWICWAALRHREEDLIGWEVQRLPLALITPMILLHSIFGGLLFHFLLDEMPIFPAIYFCFISITTIGFGDFCPKSNGLGQTLLIILYLSSGISIMSNMFGAISDHLRRIHYLGRGDFEHTQDVRIWFAGSQLTICQLVSLVAQQFGVAPERLREVLDELDRLIQLSALRAHHRNCGECGGEQLELVGGQQRPRLSVGSRKSGEGATSLLEACLLDNPEQSISSTINTEQEQVIQALGTLHRLGVKGTRTFRSPSLNSFTNGGAATAVGMAMALRVDCKRLARSMSVSPYSSTTRRGENGRRSEEMGENDGYKYPRVDKIFFSI